MSSSFWNLLFFKDAPRFWPCTKDFFVFVSVSLSFFFASAFTFHTSILASSWLTLQVNSRLTKTFIMYGWAPIKQKRTVFYRVFTQGTNLFSSVKASILFFRFPNPFVLHSCQKYRCSHNWLDQFSVSLIKHQCQPWISLATVIILCFFQLYVGKHRKRTVVTTRGVSKNYGATLTLDTHQICRMRHIHTNKCFVHKVMYFLGKMNW